MKKLLSILAVCGLTATTGTTVIGCGKGSKPSQIKEQVKAKIPPSAVEVKLVKTYQGQKLAKDDQILVQQKVVEVLKKVNQNVVIEKDTFTVLGLGEMKPDVKKVTIRVKETKSSLDKPGLKGEETSLNLVLIPLDKISLKKLGTPGFKWELGKDKSKELSEFVANLVKQLTNYTVYDYVIKGNITGSPREVGTSLIIEAKESSSIIKDSFRVALQVDISDLKSWWGRNLENSKIELPGENLTKNSINGFLFASLPGKPRFGQDYEFEGQNFKSGDEVIIRSKEGSKCLMPGKSFIIVII